MRLARRPLAAPLAVSIAIAILVVAGLPVLRAALPGNGVDVVSRAVAISVDRQLLVRLPIAASHVVLHWTGVPDAQITIALGKSPDRLGDEISAGLADGSGEDGDKNYSEVIWADGARWARVTTDRPIADMKLVAMDTNASKGIDQSGVVSAAVGQPAVITRAAWGANESYATNAGGYMRFAPSFSPVQKLIVHHTAGANNDPNPAATIRAIYYDHAVLRGYGDIGYNYLIDAQGRVYEGRRAWISTPAVNPTEEDLAGNVVRGAHAMQFNDATVGIALLGNFTSVMPTAAARATLVNLLAWKAERHGLDPKGASTYVNPISGTTKWLYNISAHRDVNQTADPGQLFYDTFPTLRQDVANRIAATTGSAVDQTPPSVLGLKPMVPNPTGARTLRFGLIFSEPVTGLTPEDFVVTGTSPGWTVQGVVGKASAYTVTVVADAGGGGPPDGSVILTLAANAVTDYAAHTGPPAAVPATVGFAAETDPPVAVLYAVPTRGEPVGTSFGISVQFNEPVTGFERTDIVLGGTSNAATPWTVELIYGQGANYNFTVDNLAPASGTLTVQVGNGTLIDLAGNPGAGSNVINEVIDRSAPTTSAPVVSLRSGASLSGSAVPITVTWSGTDVGPAGIQSYDLARSYDGAAFEVVYSGITATSVARTMAPGHTYRFEVRARDNAGNLGAWTVGPTLYPALTQQSSTAVRFSGSSTTTTYSSYSGGTERYLRATGASATYTTTARSLSFVTTKGASRGVAQIWIDGVLAATVDLYAPTFTYRFVAFSRTWSSVGTHTIKVVSVGARVRVDIDAFGVIR
ncbi:MAG: N-acetylmuramoyl-L-alanine amidase [Chloroflexi bacterium]|nr:N-acetylmuramoyl-L-alanine amidase [Chloroflexota bacterium]